jgi:hypothetical protein
MKSIEIILPSGIIAEYREKGVMLIKQGHGDVDIEMLDEPLSYEDMEVLTTISVKN